MTAQIRVPWHIADRATWDCRACGAAWPCAPARERLLATTDRRTDLLIRLAAELEEAALVLVDEPDLYHRFVGWARRSQPRQEGTR